MGSVLFTMADLEDYFARFADAEYGPITKGEYLRQKFTPDVRDKFKKKQQVRNADRLRGTEDQIKASRKAAEKAGKRQLQRRANQAAGLGSGGMRKGYFKTVKGKKTFVRATNVTTRRTKSGKIVKELIDAGEGGLRGHLRGARGGAMGLVGQNKLGQRAVEGGYRGASAVLGQLEHHPVRSGAIGAGILAAGAGGAYLLSRRNRESSSYSLPRRSTVYFARRY